MKNPVIARADCTKPIIHRNAAGSEVIRVDNYFDTSDVEPGTRNLACQRHGTRGNSAPAAGAARLQAG